MKLYIFRFEILNNEGKKDNELEKRVKVGIMDSKKLYDQKEIYGKKADTYYLVGDKFQDNNFSFYSLKKKSTINSREVIDKTAKIINKSTDNDDLGKFAINYSENLIFFYYNGHFGRKQFQEVVIEIIRKSLAAENISGYKLNIKYLECQPQKWDLKTLKDHLEKIKFIKYLTLTLTYPNNYEDENKAGKSESYLINGNKYGITLEKYDINRVLEQLNKYREVGKDEYISFECEDTEGHPFTINKSKILNFDVSALNDMEKFEIRVKDALDEYIKLYY